MAESPPPTTTSSLSRKKKPSQVAQAETPCPMSRVSDSMSRRRADAPVAMISASQVYWPVSLVTAKGRLDKSTALTVSNLHSAPKRCDCWRIRSTSSGPMIPAGKPG